MADHLTCTWMGISGKKYVYEIRPRRPTVAHHEPGNFVYAKMDEHRRWVPIYIGAGDLTQRAAMDPNAVKCIDARGATHVHLHANYDRDERSAEAEDLLENFPQARVPSGCNQAD